MCKWTKIHIGVAENTSAVRIWFSTLWWKKKKKGWKKIWCWIRMNVESYVSDTTCFEENKTKCTHSICNILKK